jgi:hypothetical protein
MEVEFLWRPKVQPFIDTWISSRISVDLPSNSEELVKISAVKIAQHKVLSKL